MNVILSTKKRYTWHVQIMGEMGIGITLPVGEKPPMLIWRILQHFLLGTKWTKVEVEHQSFHAAD